MKVNRIIPIMFLVFLVAAAGFPQSKMKTDSVKTNVKTKSMMHKKTMKNKKMQKSDIMMKKSGEIKKGKMMHDEEKDAGKMNKISDGKTKPISSEKMKSNTNTESMHKDKDTYMKKEMKRKDKN